MSDMLVYSCILKKNKKIQRRGQSYMPILGHMADVLKGGIWIQTACKRFFMNNHVLTCLDLSVCAAASCFFQINSDCVNTHR